MKFFLLAFFIMFNAISGENTSPATSAKAPSIEVIPKYKILIPERPIETSEREFHGITGRFLITNAGVGFPWFDGKEEDWRVVDIESLASLGFKKGDVIQFWRFGTSEVQKYVLKQKVNIAMVRNEYFGETGHPNFYRSFYILLDDDPLKYGVIGARNSDEMDGIAYSGNKYKLKGSYLSRPKYEDVSLKDKELNDFFYSYKTVADQEHYKYQMKKAKVATVTEKNAYSINALQVHSSPNANYESDVTGTAIKIKEDTYLVLSFPWHDANNNPSEGRYQYGEFIEGSELNIIEEDDGMHSCSTLHIVKDGKVESFKIECDSGGC